ncbi:MAG: twin-arginine translocase TatA/TatE family subunit [Actinomycetota bacterium]|jgi:sec-independent protein translocase protein TatA|nr:twin-arginine translocase TatA/TatE family subunit [Actinomycetota bacterium]
MYLALIPVLNTVGPTELIIVLAIVLLLFGAKRIPELARGLGTGIREFKRGARDEGEEKKDEELTAEAVSDKYGARIHKEAARAERTEQKR